MQKITPNDTTLTARQKIQNWPPRAPNTSEKSESASDVEITTICPACRGSGWTVPDVTADHPEFGKLVACSCLRRKRAEVLHQRLPRQLQDCTFATFGFEWQIDNRKRAQLQRALAAAQAYAAEPLGWLYLHGRGGSGNGTGKSHLAAAIAHDLTGRGQQVVFKRMMDIASSELSWEERGAMLERLARVEALIIDDMGKEYRASEKAAQFQDGVLFGLIDARYSADLPTVITSNYHPDELIEKKRYNPAIVSRIHGMALIVEMSGDDYRRRF